VTVPPKPLVSPRDENVDYFSLPEDSLYYDGELYRILPKGDVMELPTVYFEKGLEDRGA
jgi:hypothetical protein